MAGLTLNAMLFKHSQYPNAAKAFLTFMLEKDQYEPWLKLSPATGPGRSPPTPSGGVVQRSQGLDF